MFKIDDTDFGIDDAKSSFKLKILKSGDAVIDAEVFGDKMRYEKITEDFDTSPWSWTLYPPHFYLRSYPAKSGRSAGTFDANNDVDEVKVAADRHGFKATGVVFLSGKLHPFSISYTKE